MPADSATDTATKAVINDIIICLGADTDVGGKPGVSQAKVEQFLAMPPLTLPGWKQAEGNSAVLPLGMATPAALSSVKAVKPKIDDYFARCRLAAFDPRAVGALNRDDKEFLVLGAKDFTANAAEIAGFPLARVAALHPCP